jgi:hypothetical protein
MDNVRTKYRVETLAASESICGYNRACKEMDLDNYCLFGLTRSFFSKATLFAGYCLREIRLDSSVYSRLVVRSSALVSHIIYLRLLAE